MRLTRLPKESEFDWSMRQVDENLRIANRNLKQTAWMFKWLLIPLWSIIAILAILNRLW